jgi:hypothetical protein
MKKKLLYMNITVMAVAMGEGVAMGKDIFGISFGLYFLTENFCWSA